MKQNQLDDCKVKFLQTQGEFDILTKDSVWNIKKRALKEVTNKSNVPTSTYSSLICIVLFN